MPLTQKQKADWKKQMLNDYPRLAEIETVVDTLIDLYDKDEKTFHEQVKKEMKADRKGKKKVEEPQPKKPEDYILNGLMEKIEAKDVVKGIDPTLGLPPPPRDMSNDDIALTDDGMIKV
jgi:hypothetical protein